MKKRPCGKHASLELEPGIKTEHLGPQVNLHSYPKRFSDGVGPISY